MICELQDKIFSVDAQGFESLALDVFRFQYDNNSVYRSFADRLGVRVAEVRALEDIPFLPVSFFKQHDVVSGSFRPELVFESSGTSGTGNSRHFVRSQALYRESFEKAFRIFYGEPDQWCILGLLPSYLERKDASLVFMVEGLIRLSGDASSGFYLDEQEALIGLLRANEAEACKTLLIGVTFALLDLAEKFREPLRHTVVMETGGMKGRRKELIREEVHERLMSAWKLRAVHSEYGMTELLSQAYSYGRGIFHCPPWMKILLREEDDPLSLVKRTDSGTARGLVNVIDLANLYSCAFIATDDRGRLFADGSFEITGRMDASDIRGCNLMYL